MKLDYIVKDDRYFNIKQILKEEFNMSSRLILKLKNHKRIILNDEISYIDKEVKINDIIQLNIDFEEDNSNIISTEMNLDIIYEDEAMLILNKPSNIAVHPSILHYENSLSNGVKFYFDEIGLKRKLRPVNRLDRDTSGVVIFAKNEYIQECLVRQMNEHAFKKNYIAVVNGILDKKHNIINAPIARKEDSIIERCVRDNGDTAITEYYVIKEFDNMSLLHIFLQTGRTHQIRVHMQHIGYPIVGDSLYGTSSELIDRQALHACKVTFIHPITKKHMNIEANLPNDILKLMQNR